MRGGVGRQAPAEGMWQSKDAGRGGRRLSPLLGTGEVSPRSGTQWGHRTADCFPWVGLMQSPSGGLLEELQ